MQPEERDFKEHIPEVYAKVYNEYIRIGLYLKEQQQLNYRLRFEEHTLQLQVKKQTADQFRVIKVWTPKVALNSLIEIDELDNDDIKEPTEEDTQKINLTLGDIKINQEKPKEVPKEILADMTPDEQKAITDAFNLNTEHRNGNRITMTCKTRIDALLLGKWKGIQGKGTYTQNPLPECFTNTTWKNTHE